MPKAKKPAGGRPAKNFDPRYGAKKATTGSRSPGHRGYKPDEADAPRKSRWSAEDRDNRVERDSRRGGPSSRPSRPRYEDDRRSERPARGDRSPNSMHSERANRQNQPSRPVRERSEHPERFGRSAHPARDRQERFDRTDRFERGGREDRYDRADRFERTERPARERFERDDRPARPRYDRDERPARFDRDDRPARPRYDRDDRAPRRDSLERDSRPTRGRFERDERPTRPRYDRDERPARPTHDRFDRDDRAPRRDRDERSNSSYYPEKKGKFEPVEDVVLERLQAQAIEAADVTDLGFNDLGLGNNLCRALAELGAEKPFPIQAATIPVVLSGKDVLGRGKTGSGKTIAFGAPLVERLMENNGGKDRKFGRDARALILAPTRELAMQINRTVEPLAKSVGLFTTTVYGGVPQGRQVQSLRRGVDIIIATPGRLEDLTEQGHIDLGKITMTVLDEADHMCELGFLEPVQRILRSTKPGGQRLLFSATLDSGVASIIDEFLVDPQVHEVAGEDQASSTIDHHVLVVEHRDKGLVIERLADRDGKTLIFTRTRAYAERLADELDDAGIPATSLHGDLNQNRRTRHLQLLTSGRVNVLVATDVAARGIHVDDVDLVIQADAPDEYKTYTHRAGRTGRAGKQGTVVTIIPKTRQRRMNDLLQRAEIDAPMVAVGPGDDLLDQLAGRE